MKITRNGFKTEYLFPGSTNERRFHSKIHITNIYFLFLCNWKQLITLTHKHDPQAPSPFWSISYRPYNYYGFKQQWTQKNMKCKQTLAFKFYFLNKLFNEQLQYFCHEIYPWIMKRIHFYWRNFKTGSIE